MSGSTLVTTGELVKLKSGGPLMTVGIQAVGSGYNCIWFVGEQMFHGVFPAAALKVVPTDQEKIDGKLP